MKKRYLCALFMLLMILLLSTLAFGNIVANSKNWQDVYSVMAYSRFMSTTPQFLVSEEHSTLLMHSLSKTAIIHVIESKTPWVVDYAGMLKARGFDADSEVYSNVNLDLAKKLNEVSNYVIVDGAYGYNSIAVAPYAALTDSYVLFANRRNIGDIVDWFDEHGVDKLLVYGHVEREVIDALQPYNPDVINFDGDRFANNVEIVKRFKEIKDERQVLLSNGEFIEAEFFTGDNPVLFIGEQNVPDKIREYIQNSNIEVGVLIGNELVGTATVVRRQTGISTFVKFGRSARNPNGPISHVEGLDIFRIPGINLNLSIEAVNYNILTKQMEITLKNNEDVGTYFKGTYTLRDDVGTTFGDVDVNFIEANQFKTMVYENIEIDLDTVNRMGAFIIFGEAKNALELVLQGEYPINSVEVLDKSEIALKKLEYDVPKKRFILYVENVGETDTFVASEAHDMDIAGELGNYGSEKTIKIKSGKTGKSYIPVEMLEDDFEANKIVHITAFYGERETALIKTQKKDFEFTIRRFDVLSYVPLVLIIALIILILLTMTRKECKICGAKNYRFKKKCKKCKNRM